MYRNESVTAAATAIAAHSAALGLSTPTPDEDGLGAFLASLDAHATAHSLDLDRELATAHLERGRSTYLVTVSDRPSAHDGPRGPRTCDLEVVAFSLRQALELSLDGARPRQWVAVRPGSDPALAGFEPADPDRYAAQASVRQGTWDDVAPALADDRAWKRREPLPSRSPFSVTPARDGIEAAAAALSAFRPDQDAAAPEVALRHVLASLFDYAEARGTSVGNLLREVRADRDPESTPSPR